MHFRSCELFIVMVQNTVNVMPEEERSHGTISNWTYVRYVWEGGNTLLTIFFILVFILAEVCKHYKKELRQIGLQLGIVDCFIRVF